MAKKRCGETIELGDGRTLTCALPAGHDGPVHTDEHGESWGDPDLPLPDRERSTR